MANKYVQAFKKARGYGEEKQPLEQSLERLGINVLLDRKLEQKLEALQRLYDMLEEEIETKDPLEYLNILNTRLKMLNRAIHSLSAPSYKASTYAAFKDLQRSSGTIHRHINHHNNRVHSVGICDKCERVGSELAKVAVD